MVHSDLWLRVSLVNNCFLQNTLFTKFFEALFIFISSLQLLAVKMQKKKLGINRSTGQ